MKLEWIGHACFRMTAEDGTMIVTDPYDDSVGIRVPKLTADLVTVSHEHHDHNNLDIVEGRPKVAREARAAQVGGVTTQAVTSYHDDRGGALRGRNNVRIFRIDALKVVHMGDQGCMPDETVMQAILDADVMMIPVGGFYTIDARQAAELAKKIAPAVTVPMHYRGDGFGYDVIAPVGDFLRLMDNVVMLDDNVIEPEKLDAPVVAVPKCPRG